MSGASPDDLAALHRAVADACLGAGPRDDADLRAFLEARGVADDDVAAILSAPRRLGIYRSLVRNGLASVVTRMLPQTRERLNRAGDGRFDRDFAAFLAESGPRTHYLRDVPDEFCAWAAPRWREDADVPRYVPDLAAHELASFAVAAREPRSAAPLAEIAVDRPVAFADAVHLARYAWAVHELGAGEPGGSEPAQRDVHLLAYRDADHAVRWLELTPLAASITTRLLAGEALGEAIARACADHATTPPAVAGAIAQLLADLGERGVILGARVRARA